MEGWGEEGRGWGDGGFIGLIASLVGGIYINRYDYLTTSMHW